MVKYSISRLLQSAVTVLIVATIVFLLMRALPTDYFFTEEEVMKLTEQQKHDRLEAAGLNDPSPNSSCASITSSSTATWASPGASVSTSPLSRSFRSASRCP